MTFVIPEIAAERTYTSADVAEMAGVTYRSLMRWAKQNLIEPQKASTERKRSPLIWSPKNVREAIVLGQLRNHQLPLQTIRKVMDYLKSLGHNPFSSGQFVCIGRERRSSVAVKICSTGEVLDLIQRGQLVLPLELIRNG